MIVWSLRVLFLKHDLVLIFSLSTVVIHQHSLSLFHLALIG